MTAKNESPSESKLADAVKPEPRRLWPTVRRLLRTRILAGLVTVIPIWVTWVVVKFVFDLMRSVTEPIAGPATRMLTDRYSQLVPAVASRYVDYGVSVLAVLMTLFLLYLLGLLTASVFGRRLIYLVDLTMGKLPLVKSVYNATKQVMMTLGGSQSKNFKRVVLVEFPRPGMKCIGFLSAVMKDGDTGRDMATVFISTTPNPTTGYMQILPLDEVSDTGWTVEEAVRLLMSGGILTPPTVSFDKIHPVRIPLPENGAVGDPETGDTTLESAPAGRGRV
jgi:uncharacterized membrane protein